MKTPREHTWTAPSLTPYLVIIFSAVVFWYKLIFTRETMFFDMTTRYFQPIFSLFSGCVRRLELPLWNPHIFCGMPFLANPQSAAFYPPSYLFVLFKFPAALNAFIVLHTMIAGVFMYLLAADMDIKPAGAVLAAFMFMFNGFSVLHAEFLSNAACFAWLPAAVYFLGRFIKEKRPVFVVMVSLALIMQFFAGHTGFFYYSILFLSTYYITFGIDYSDIKASFKTGLAVFAAVFAIWLLITAVQTLPAIELTLNSARFSTPDPASAAVYSIKPADFVRFALLPFWDHYKPFYEGDVHVIGFYFGLTAAALFALGAFRMKGKACIFLFITVIVCSLCALGKYFPLFSLFYHVIPGWKYFRFPAQLMFLAAFAVSLFIGIYSGEIRNPFIKYAVISAVFLELFIFNIKANRLIDKSYYTEPAPNLEFLSKDSSLYRIMLTPRTESEPPEYDDGLFKRWLNFKNMLYPNTGAAYGISYADGDETLKPRTAVELLNAVRDPSSQILDIMNVKYIVSRWYINARDLKLVKDGYTKIYENVNCLPRFYFADKVTGLEHAEALRLVSSPDFNPADAILVENAGSAVEPARAGGRSLEVKSYGPNKTTLKTVTDEASWLFDGDSYYPGWKAFIDGTETRIFRADYNFRAVFVPKGSHEITFCYSPTLFKAGAVISSVSCVLLLCVLIFTRTAGRFKGSSA